MTLNFHRLGLPCALALVCAAPATPPLAAETNSLALSAHLDLSRLVADSDERRLLRLEWRAQASRAEEGQILGEMLTRLGRVEATTRDLFRLIEAIPAAADPHGGAASRSRPEATSAPHDQPLGPPAESNPLVPRPVRIAAVALVIGLALILTLRVRRQRAVVVPDMEEPTVLPEPPPPPAPSAKTLRTRKHKEGSPATPMEQVIAQVTQTPDKTSPQPATPLELPPSPASSSREAAPTSSGQDVDQTLELAEIMLAMGLSSSASNALVQHIQRNPRQALAHWLKLLDIYRRDGHRADFERAARELRQNFNIRADDWMGTERTARSLEDFERILNQIGSLCERPAELIDYLTHLLEDNREGIRTGFPQNVAEEMVLLMAVMREHLGGAQALSSEADAPATSPPVT